jgi:hypothetical protein
VQTYIPAPFDKFALIAQPLQKVLVSLLESTFFENEKSFEAFPETPI